MKSLNVRSEKISGAILKIGLLGLLSVALVPATTNAAIVVVPGGNATVEGTPDGSASYYPFGGEGTPNTQRYQQIYNGASFGFTGPQLITQIAFRPDASFGSAFSTTIPNIQINLSTSSRTASTLSTTFANNVGADDTVVFGSGTPSTASPLNLSSGFTAGPGNTKSFDIILSVQPFLYDPSQGSLLLDVRLYNSGFTSPVRYFDTQTSSTDGIARVATGNAGNYLQAVGDVADTTGLVTQFTFAPVPEPTTYGCIAGLGALSFAGISLRRKK